MIFLPSNIFIVRKDIFCDYVEWLFDILNTYEKYLIEDNIVVPPRHIGYVAEILQSIYFLRNSQKLNILFAKRKFLF